MEYKTSEEKRAYQADYAKTHKEEKQAYDRKYWKIRYAKNSKQYLENRAKATRERKLLVLSHYSSNPPKCACPPCGETIIEFLSIDHIIPIGNKARDNQLGTRHGSNLYGWLIRHNFPEGFQVLCMNCNFAKGHYDKCPHERL
jgi:5-methylcytosine-specific restriction endonuclease McrA